VAFLGLVDGQLRPCGQSSRIDLSGVKGRNAGDDPQRHGRSPASAFGFDGAFVTTQNFRGLGYAPRDEVPP
jgi:hypothetical protein